MLQAVETNSTSTMHPDRALLTACDMFIALQRRMNAHDDLYCRMDGDSLGEPPAGSLSDEEAGDIHDEQVDLVQRMAKARSVTLDGHVARARALATWPPEIFGESDQEIVPPLISAIMRDPVAFSGDAVA